MKEEIRYRDQRREVACFMRRLYDRGLTTISGGNISMRAGDDCIVITPSATDKGRMRWNEVGIISLSGKNLTPHLKPSIELEMHLSIYRKKSDISAVVHAHPVFASSYTAMKTKIDTTITSEACAILGDPQIVPYALMGTKDLATLVTRYISVSDILLLENHGVLTTGESLLIAFDKIEVLENAAKMTFITEMTGKKSPLAPEKINEIKKLFR